MTQQTFIYSIYDRKAMYYLPPFVCRSDTDAERQFTEAVTTSETPISLYPADFDLMKIGVMDLETAQLQGLQPMPVVNGLVALEQAHRQRARYAAILGTPQAANASPRPANGQADLEDYLPDPS